jgi:Ca-activated chloride channel family protein
MNKLIFIITGFLIVNSLPAQNADDIISKGNEFYKQQKYTEAEKEYQNALEKFPGNTTAIHNLGSVKYRLNKTDEAKKEFGKLSAEKNDAPVKEKAFYNTGVVLSKEKKLEESIEAYKNALRINPADKETRENLQKALLELKAKKQPEKKKEDQKKKKEENKKQQPPKPKLNRREVEKQLNLLQQKEKDVKQRMQNEKMKEGGSNPKDW